LISRHDPNPKKGDSLFGCDHAGGKELFPC
jgi:hypothetical protein